MLNRSTNLWDRLLEVLEADNLDQAAEKLGLNPSTLRGRKARDAVPYEEIVQKLDAKELAYVLKNEKLDNSISEEDLEPAENSYIRIPEIDKFKTAEEAQVHYEKFATEVIDRVKDAPLSTNAKLSIVDSLIRIVGTDLKKVQKQKSQKDPDPDENPST